MTELLILRHFAQTEQDNPFIAHLNYAFTDRENFYFVMDFYPGGDLATQMELHTALGPHRTRFYAVDIVLGLEDLSVEHRDTCKGVADSARHRHGVIVRDLKPENILLNRRGHAVLADFGLSKQFPYRGQPRPVHVVQYPNQPDVPEWAGMGMGSARVGLDGKKHVLLDTARSFVGTAEYLAPEVVRGLEYTYAIDWWALGCIILECLVGRVPFKSEKDETVMDLWNKILSDPWDEFFEDPMWARHTLDKLGIDADTYRLLDGLLQKDPMWRLTEPYVRVQEYFANIDWETVRLGQYEDPYGLQFHDVDELNTQYFPKLCLQEEPSVDMSDHGRQDSDDRQPSALNDNALYALQQAKFREQLEDFAWSPEEEPASEVADKTSPGIPGTLLEPDMFDDPIELSRVVGDDEEIGTSSTQQVEGVEREDEVADRAASMIGANVTARSPSISPSQHRLRQESVAASLNPPSPRLLPASPRSTVSKPSFQLDPGSPVSPAVVTPSHSELHGVERGRLEEIPGDAVEVGQDKSLESEGQTAVLELPPHSKTAVTKSRPVPIAVEHETATRAVPREGLPQGGLSVSDMISVPSPELNGRHRVLRRHAQERSDDGGSTHRLSVDMNGAIRHLEDEEWEELDASEHGPSAPNGSGEAAPSTFFTRNFGQVLRRKPSMVQTSGLRRVTRGSDSSLESSARSSPTKSPTKPRPGSSLFAPKSRDIPKRALEKIKVFPKLRKVSASNSKRLPPQSPRKRDGRGDVAQFDVPPIETMPGYTASTQPPTPTKQEAATPPRPGPPQRAHTESQWWERRPKLQKKISMHEDEPVLAEGGGGGDGEGRMGMLWRRKSKRVVSTPPSPERRAELPRLAPKSGKSASQQSLLSAKSGASGAGGAPRVELRETPPVDWGLEQARVRSEAAGSV